MRFILDLSQHPNLAKGFDEYQKGKDSFKERQEFIKRQSTNLHNDIEKTQKEFWEHVTTYAKEHGLLPNDYSKDKHCMEIDNKSRQLFLHEHADHDHGSHPMIEAIIGAFTRGPEGPDGKGN